MGDASPVPTQPCAASCQPRRVPGGGLRELPPQIFGKIPQGWGAGSAGSARRAEPTRSRTPSPAQPLLRLSRRPPRSTRSAPYRASSAAPRPQSPRPPHASPGPGDSPRWTQLYHPAEQPKPDSEEGCGAGGWLGGPEAEPGRARARARRGRGRGSDIPVLACGGWGPRGPTSGHVLAASCSPAPAEVWGRGAPTRARRPTSGPTREGPSTAQGMRPRRTAGQ